jgi:hypothetical protein
LFFGELDTPGGGETEATMKTEEKQAAGAVRTMLRSGTVREEMHRQPADERGEPEWRPADAEIRRVPVWIGMGD